MALPSRRLAVFIDGDRLHGLPSRRIPDAWRRQIDVNRGHDAWVTYLLEQDCWTVLRFWEYEICRNLDSCVEAVTRAACR